MLDTDFSRTYISQGTDRATSSKLKKIAIPQNITPLITRSGIGCSQFFAKRSDKTLTCTYVHSNLSKIMNKNFGGDWTDAKLKALAAYLQAYTTALKHTPFRLAYIDAFAGAGSREIAPESSNLIDERLKEDDQRYRHGSPLIALLNDPPFDTLIFIEKNPSALKSLRDQVEKLPAASGREIKYLKGDANEQIKKLALSDWSRNRAVAFLDPFALQVDWNTIELIAKTEAVDMWLLFPAMAVNRMMPKSGEIPEKWVDRLNRLFGSDNWQDVFYAKEPPDLFGEETTSKTQQVFEALSNYVTGRLGRVFAKANKKPLILRNRTGAPIFLLCFASGNPKGAPIAVKIAQHIIDTSTHG